MNSSFIFSQYNGIVWIWAYFLEFLFKEKSGKNIEVSDNEWHWATVAIDFYTDSLQMHSRLFLFFVYIFKRDSMHTQKTCCSWKLHNFFFFF